jgi:hypothetical protein
VFEVHGSELRVVGIEIYDSRVVIRWCSAPIPDAWSAFPEKRAALERDMDGLEEWAKVELRRNAERRMHRLLMYDMALADDVGTTYLECEFHGGGTYKEWNGDAAFRPAPSPAASVLTLTWLGTDAPLPLT